VIIDNKREVSEEERPTRTNLPSKKQNDPMANGIRYSISFGRQNPNDLIGHSR